MSLFVIPLINMPVSYYDLIPTIAAGLAVIVAMIRDGWFRGSHG